MNAQIINPGKQAHFPRLCHQICIFNALPIHSYTKPAYSFTSYFYLNFFWEPRNSACMKNFYLATFLVLVNSASFSQTRKMVAIGSSTTAGQGSFPLDSSWVNRFNHYYKYELMAIDSTYNLGVGGYSCYKGMPTSYIPPPNRPGPDAAKNVTRDVEHLNGA